MIKLKKEDWPLTEMILGSNYYSHVVKWCPDVRAPAATNSSIYAAPKIATIDASSLSFAISSAVPSMLFLCPLSAPLFNRR